MITNSKQLKASKCAANDLREIILSRTDPTIPESLAKINRKILSKKLEKIEQDISEYESLITLDTSKFTFDNFEDLLKAPIKYRLANKETVKDFAREMRISQRQILRYEEESYSNCTISTLLKILNRIGIKISGEIKIQPKTTTE